MPWIEIPNLGSHILAIVRRRLPEDSAQRYNTTPVLVDSRIAYAATGTMYAAPALRC